MSTLFRALLLGAVLSAGCATDAGQPKDAAWGKQPCEECAMLLSDPHHGAQLVTTDGERLYFDDLGCMAEWSIEHPRQAERQWVRTEDTQQWILAEHARFQRGRQSPMGFGLVASSDAGEMNWAEASTFVEQRLRER